MARLKVLFADDQIPDENLPDDDIELRRVLKYKHPQWDVGSIKGFVIMRQAVKILRDAGYAVTVARTHKGALDLVKKEHFDIAIIDLNWKADEELPEDQRESAGWEICDAIEEADNKFKSKPTSQIMYSNKFDKDPSISIRAAAQGKLPLFKSYNEAGHQALTAAVTFIGGHLTVQERLAIDRVKEIHRTMNQYWEEPLKHQRLWFKLTVVFVSLSISLLLAGAIGAIFWDRQVGTLIPISSILTSAISSLLLVQLQRIRKNVEKSQENIEEVFKEEVERLYPKDR